MMLFLGLLFLSLLSVRAEASSLTVIGRVLLPGVGGRFDHFSMDTKGHRLFVAALGNNSLEVVDTTGGKHLKSIAGLREPTGVLYLADANQIAVANGDDGRLKVFDGSSYTLVKSVGSLDDADNLRFDPKAKLIYAGYGNGALGIINASGMKVTGSVKLAGHPESFQLEKDGSRIFVNVPGAKQIAVIDRLKQTITSTWPMTEYQANFPMALDEENHRLFVGCRSPSRLVVFDTNSGKAVANLPISGDSDDLFYDSRLKRVYISCGEGSVDVIDQKDRDHYQTRERVTTRSGARTCYFSASFNQLYLAVPQHGKESAEIRIFRTNQ